MGEVVVQVTRVGSRGEPLPLPRYATVGSAGLDLQADVASPVTLSPLGRALVPTGLAIALPPGHEAQVRPRSGLALRSGITLLNSPGTIDADYRGPVGVIVVNFGAEPFTIRRGDRIAQLVLAPVATAAYEETLAHEATLRGEGGFGSTGH